MGPLERAFVRVDQPPWAELLRVALGYVVVPAWSGLTGGEGSGGTPLSFFLIVLLGLRLIPAALQRLLPFGGSSRAIWAERRQLAKRFDSYQWRKLFWIGLGLALYIGMAERRPDGAVILTLACLVSGILGSAIWRRHAARLESSKSPRQTHNGSAGRVNPAAGVP